MGVGLEAEQLGAVGAELHDLAMIWLVSFAPPLSPRLTNALPHLLAKRAVVGEGQDRIDRRAGVDDRVDAGGKLALLGGGGAAPSRPAGTPFISASLAAMWVLSSASTFSLNSRTGRRAAGCRRKAAASAPR
jgi:hypothetical protein